MGILKKYREKKKLKKTIARNKEYLKHYKMAKESGGSPMTYGEYQKYGKTYQYYKLKPLQRKSVEAQLRESGVSEEDMQMLRGKKKKKKK